MAWSLVSTLGTPPARRSHHGAIYDPDGDRMIIFGGGNESEILNDVWELALSGTPTWSQISLSGPTPPYRSGSCVAFDRARDRILLFGGYGVAGVCDDVWSLSLGDSVTWTPLVPAGSGGLGRARASAVLDSMGDRLVVFGGFSPTGAQVNDVWSLRLSDPVAWTQLMPLGTLPPARASQCGAMDPVLRRMVVFGGSGPSDLNDTWLLSLGDTVRWTRLAVSSNDPPARHYATAAYDTDSGRVIVACGARYNSPNLGDVWGLSSDSWSRLSEGGRAWDLGTQSAIFYDPSDDGLVGFETTIDLSSGTESYSLTAWTMPLDGVPRRSLVTPTGTAPVARFGYSVILDPTRRRLVFFGGKPGQFRLSLDEVWVLDLSGAPAWLRLNPAGQSPPNMIWHSAIYDPTQDRMIVFGGDTDTLMNGYPYGTKLNDTWSLNFAGTPTWARLSPGGTPPPPREMHGATYDPVEHRMIVYAGNGNQTADVWALSLSDPPQWSALHMWDPHDSPRYLFSASTVYDPQSDRLIVFGGEASNQSWSDTWAINLRGTPAWTQISSSPAGPAPRQRAGAVYDPIRQRMLVQGGGDNLLYTRGYFDLWEMRFASSLSVATPTAPIASFLEAPWPNPMGASARVGFSLPERAHVSLAVYDMAGRRVASLWEGPAPSGTSVRSWDGRSHGGQRLPVGVYLIALTAGGRRQVRRLVMLEPGAR
jgi:hypothetical protein